LIPFASGMDLRSKSGRVFLTVAACDWQLLRRDRTLPAIIALFVAFIAYAVHTGIARVRIQRDFVRLTTRIQDDLIATQRAEILNYERTLSRNPNSKRPDLTVNIGLRGMNAMLPPATLAALAIGQADVYPISATVNMFNHQHELFTQVEHENPLNLLNGIFDLAFVIVYLYPLFILALSYNLLSAEREQGVLAMTLAQPVGLRQMAFAKCALRAGIFCALGIMSSVGAILFTGFNFSSKSDWTRILLWLATVVLYGVFWFAVSLTVNALGARSAANAIVLVSVWVFLVLVVPSLLHLVASYMYSAPARMELIHAARRSSNEGEEEGKSLVTKYYAAHPEFAGGDKSPNYTDEGRLYYAVHAKITRDLEPLMSRFYTQLDRQQQLINRYCFVSPAIIAQEALNDLAGTGAARFALFRSQATALQSAFQSFFISPLFKGVRIASKDFDSLPRFNWREEETTDVTLRVASRLAALSVLCVLAGIGATAALRNYPTL
jgi:ABC-2 type transport system permease protein